MKVIILRIEPRDDREAASVGAGEQRPGKLIIGPWKARWPWPKPSRRSPRKASFVQLDLFEEA